MPLLPIECAPIALYIQSGGATFSLYQYYDRDLDTLFWILEMMCIQGHETIGARKKFTWFELQFNTQLQPKKQFIPH